MPAVAEAALRAWSAPRLISPRRSITPVPSCSRISAPNSDAGIWRLLQMHDQLDGVVVLVNGGPELVDHVLDEEQAPAPRRLQPGQLGLDVGGLDLREGALAPLVGDAHLHVGPVGDHADLDRELGPVAVAVLDGVHGRLADGRLEPLQAGAAPARPRPAPPRPTRPVPRRPLPPPVAPAGAPARRSWPASPAGRRPRVTRV